MIQKELISQFDLNHDLYLFIRHLIDFDIVVTGNKLSNLTVYRRINGIYEQIILKGPETSISAFYNFSSHNVYLFCTAWDQDKNTLLIVIFHLEKQYLVYTKHFQQCDQIVWVEEEFQAQVFILENEKIKVFDFRRYPEISEYSFKDQVQGVELIYLQKLGLLKISRNLEVEYYLLPLCRTSQKLNFNYSDTNSLFVRFNSIRYLLCVAKENQKVLYDIRNAHTHDLFTSNKIKMNQTTMIFS